MVDLVISAYRADLAWLFTMAGCRMFVIDKGDDACPKIANRYPFATPPPFECEHLLNRGKCDHTVSHFIVEHYDDLADWTVFSPDHPFDHLPQGVPFAQMLEPAPRLAAPWVCTVNDCGPDGRIPWETFRDRPDANGTNWADRYASGIITRARLSFVEWAKEFTGCDLFTDWAGYHPGGVFGVRREAILAHPKAFYERIREQLSHSVEPEEGHYMERLWLWVFGLRAEAKKEAPATRFVPLPTSWGLLA